MIQAANLLVVVPAFAAALGVELGLIDFFK
jgi:hypothetical protein